MYNTFLFCLNMNKFKYIQIILFGFLILKESSCTNPLQNEKKCSPHSQAQNEQFPYIVFIKMHSNGEILCQGTLIDVNWVITSAYCMNNISLNNIDIVMRNNKTRETILKPSRVIETKYNDVALIEMEKYIITDSMMVTSIELATEELSNNTKCVVISLQKQSKNDLSLIYWNVVNILKQEYDKSEYYLEDTICHSQIWNLLQNITDNGAPLICNSHLYGIYSLKEPNIFNNIFKYNNWIKNVINPISSDKTSEKLTTNFIANYNFVTDTNLIVTKDIIKIDMKDKSSLDTEDKRTYSKPKSMPNFYSPKESRNIAMYLKYTSVRAELIDAKNTQSVELSSKGTEKTLTSLFDVTDSDDLISPKFLTQSNSSIIIKSLITEKPTSNSSPATSIIGKIGNQKYSKESIETDNIYDKPSSEPFPEETEETPDKSSSEPFTGATEKTEYTTETTETKETEKTEETEETSDKSSSEPFTEVTKETSDKPSSKPFTGATETTEYTTETKETEETSDKSSSEPFTEITEVSSDKPSSETSVFQSSTTEKFTSSSNPSTTITEETEEMYNTEDDPYSDMPSTHRSTTQSSTTKVSTSSPNPTTAITKETKDTDITEDGPITDKPCTTVTERTKQTSQTDTTVTYYNNSTITTIIPSTTTTNQSSINPNTTLSGDELNTTKITTTPTTTRISTAVTYDISDSKESSTFITTTPTTTRISTAVTYDISDSKESSTFVDDQYQDKSSSQLTSIHTSLIAVVFCIVYHTNL
ncbi:flocculation protein FLO11-like isoform X3 [Melanaphis sacchari]|uniref:flocculation protein FLO11-like isoform X3 n=1 Tax=Melanaphis sacchari TaxID=742174 RepID=UPI000DC1475F|nr:flocculation protein FLO11-like isoform X3 [Melanaphis sacchari]